MIIDAGTQFEAVIGGERCRILVRSAQMTMSRNVIDYIDGPEVIGPTSIELDVNMIVVPLGRLDEPEDCRDIHKRNALGIERGS